MPPQSAWLGPLRGRCFTRPPLKAICCPSGVISRHGPHEKGRGEPPRPAPFTVKSWSVDRLYLTLDCGLRRTVRNLDPARLQRFGHFTHEADMEHAVLMARLGHTDVIGKGEAALEGSGGDLAMQEMAFARFLGLAARDNQRILAQFDIQVGRGKARDSD